MSKSIDTSVFIAEGARLIGEITIGEESSVWFNAVIRADMGSVSIGHHTNVQDNATIHMGVGYPVTIGDYVTIGHNAVVHGCTVGNNVMIGMGATIMNGAKIGDNAIIAAGAVVTQNMEIPEGALVVGCPATVKKQASPEQILHSKENAIQYAKLAQSYMQRK